MTIMVMLSEDSNFRKGNNNEFQLSTIAQDMSMLCVKEARDDNLRSLIARKKLHLVLDLDHTLLHTVTLNELTPSDRECLRHRSRRNWLKEGKLFMIKDNFLVKPRPNVHTFLKEASTMFDLSVFTLGTKGYATKAVEILDPNGLYISPSNVFSVEDCKRPMIKGLDVMNLNERVSLIVDDIKRVWVDHPKNVIEIEPYLFFEVKSNSKRTNMKHAGLQMGGDESEKYGELARVLRELKKIHIAFFDNTEASQVGYENRDVRDVVEDVRNNFRLLK
ncbi:RNA polymerase II C-terminal domain phosphatase-like 4 [Silene latifolia]|uniref:RNA polymerase II C-terminal domain phosphatase-like 4 n=1 Tax=Silene latifolia TaxID=37657 RepID=UPI003D773E72